MLHRAALSTAVICAALACSAAAQFRVLEHLASKTPYRPLQDFAQHTPPPTGCAPVHLNLVNRHGTRAPSEDDILEFSRIQTLISQNAANLNPAFASWMLAFKNPFQVQYEQQLLRTGIAKVRCVTLSGTYAVRYTVLYTGKVENYEMAKRIKRAFPNLFSQGYDSINVAFRTTQEQRAVLSGQSFGLGLFEGAGDLGSVNYEPLYLRSDTESEDVILKFYDNCPRYDFLVGDNDLANQESPLYLDTFLGALQQRLTNSLTVNRSWNVTEEDALALWALCQAQGNSEFIVDQFCSLFTETEVYQLEYYEDLDDYYSKSYPFPISYEMVAPLLQDMYKAMVKVISGDRSERVNLRFAHSSTIVPLLTAMGMYRDVAQLRHDSPQSVIDSRQFRTSIVSAKNTNVALVLYECPATAQFYVKALHSEREMLMDGCAGQVYCPFPTFEESYRGYFEADFEALCTFPGL